MDDNAKTGSAQKQEKKYFTIGEVAELLDVNRSLIRYWEKQFNQIQPKKNRKGHRLFTAKDIEELKFIYFLVKDKGYSIEGAKQIIENQQKIANDEYEMAEILKRTRSFLLEMKSYLSDDEK